MCQDKNAADAEALAVSKGYERDEERIFGYGWRGYIMKTSNKLALSSGYRELPLKKYVGNAILRGTSSSLVGLSRGLKLEASSCTGRSGSLSD